MKRKANERGDKIKELKKTWTDGKEQRSAPGTILVVCQASSKRFISLAGLFLALIVQKQSAPRSDQGEFG